MESWKRRLKYYGIGFGIGLIFVFFFFQNRGCSWLPDNRVKNAILDRLIVVSDETKAEMKKLNISINDLIGVLNDGDVDFSKSVKDADDKVYLIQKDGKSFCFSLPKESFISEVVISDDPKQAKFSNKGELSFVRFPADENLIYVDSNSVLTCMQDELGLVDPKLILKEIKVSGKLILDKSDLKATPKAEHYIRFQHKGEEVNVRAIWYKNKVNITEIEVPYDTKCKKGMN